MLLKMIFVLLLVLSFIIPRHWPNWVPKIAPI